MDQDGLEALLREGVFHLRTCKLCEDGVVVKGARPGCRRVGAGMRRGLGQRWGGAQVQEERTCAWLPPWRHPRCCRRTLLLLPPVRCWRLLQPPPQRAWPLRRAAPTCPAARPPRRRAGEYGLTEALMKYGHNVDTLMSMYRGVSWWELCSVWLTCF